VALAAQPTLQNLLSGFTLYADRPISVGDFCRFGDKTGTVEEIGLRSTRLRTVDRTVISVPNAQFLDMELENFSRRDRFYFATTLQLRYETTPDQMRYVLVELRKLLIAHPMVVPEPMRVRFKELGAHSLDIELYCYILSPDSDVYAAAREDLLLRIMSTVEEAGAQFAFPSIVSYAAQDVAPDTSRVHEIEAKVEKWRVTETLPFPDFEWQTKAELSGTLDYPPLGSVDRRTGSAS
jgi:small-conductance mechanosensitive channel